MREVKEKKKKRGCGGGEVEEEENRVRGEAGQLEAAHVKGPRKALSFSLHLHHYVSLSLSHLTLGRTSHADGDETGAGEGW